jgi:dTDP-4-amino-4,6-dideoxygalactose transaminase
MKEKIWLSPPHMGGKEQKYINEAFETNWIAPLGPNVDGMESDLTRITEKKYALTLNSATSAIHLALIILGVKQGDYVICQDFTFCASANPIVYLGASPVFVDSEKDTWNMSPAYLEQSILACMNGTINGKAQKPKAIIPVHLYGVPAKMDEIMAIAHKYEIPVIEDAAEAIGSTFLNKPCGSFGELGVLSFNGNKIITTSAGGALVSDNEEYIKHARFLSTQARDQAPHYQHSQVGYNYRMSNINAGIGRGQLEVLQDRVLKRRQNFEFYKEKLGDIKGFQFLEEPKNAFSNRWLTCLLVNPSETNGVDREAIRLALEKENIESRPLWKPMHLQPIYENSPYFGEGFSAELFEKGLCLPSGSNLSDEDLQRVVNAVLGCFQD